MWMIVAVFAVVAVDDGGGGSRGGGFYINIYTKNNNIQ